MKILMIEDQTFFSEMMVNSLEGIDVEVVESLRAARARLDKGGYDMVLVDLGLPDSQGLDTLRALQGYKVPKVVLTSRYDVEPDVSKLGVTDYVIKGAFEDVYERVLFNLAKVRRRPRFSENVFREIRACFECVRPLELTGAQ